MFACPVLCCSAICFVQKVQHVVYQCGSLCGPVQLSVCSHLEQPRKKALELYSSQRVKMVKPDVVTFNTLMGICISKDKMARGSNPNTDWKMVLQVRYLSAVMVRHAMLTTDAAVGSLRSSACSSLQVTAKKEHDFAHTDVPGYELQLGLLCSFTNR
jgi:hypothetical protein